MFSATPQQGEICVKIFRFAHRFSSALVREQPVLLGTGFVLLRTQNCLTKGHFAVKSTRRGLVVIVNGPNTVSESKVSNTELSEFFSPSPSSGGELSEFLSAYYLCAKANSLSFSQNSPSLPQNSVSSLLRNSALETVFRPFPKYTGQGSLVRTKSALSKTGHFLCKAESVGVGASSLLPKHLGARMRRGRTLEKACFCLLVAF